MPKGYFYKMANFYTVNGQDVFDVVLQNYGDLEGGFENFVTANQALNVGAELIPGQKVAVNPSGVGDVLTKEFFENNASVLNNADPVNYAALVSNYDFQNEGDYDFQNTDIYDFN